MEQVKQICRLCLVASRNATSSINDAEMNSQLKIIFKFEFATDGTLPKAICSECSSKVAEFHSFHESVRTNQNLLLATGSHEKEKNNVFVSVDTEERPSTGDVGKEEDFGEEDLFLASAVKTELKETVDEPEDATKNEPDSSEDENYSPHSDDDDDDDDDDDATTATTTKKSPTKRIRIRKSAPLGDRDWKLINFFGGLKCEICSETCETFNKMKRHYTRAHNKKGSITCCGQSYDVKHKLLEHIDTHFDPTMLYCKICDKHYKTKVNLDLHNQKKHSGTEQNPFACDKCDQRFPKKCMLTTHSKTHIKAKCPICERMLANYQCLRTHMKIQHSDVKPVKPDHMCEQCGKTYHTKPELKRHINKFHLGISEEKIQCPVCFKWLCAKNSLKMHMNSAHSVVERVACEICNKTVMKHVLASHKRKVHGKKEFDCNVCGQTFPLKRILKEHQTTH